MHSACSPWKSFGIVSWTHSSLIDGPNDIGVRQRLGCRARQLIEPINRVVLSDRLDDRLQPSRGFAAIGEHKSLASTNLLENRSVWLRNSDMETVFTAEPSALPEVKLTCSTVRRIGNSLYGSFGCA